MARALHPVPAVIAALLAGCAGIPGTPGAPSLAHGDPDIGTLDTGLYRCVESRQIRLDPAADPRHLRLTWLGNTFEMTRLESPSGLIRYESRNGNLVWVHTPSKSVLLDTNTSRPLAMGCRAT